MEIDGTGVFAKIRGVAPCTFPRFSPKVDGATTVFCAWYFDIDQRHECPVLVSEASDNSTFVDPTKKGFHRRRVHSETRPYHLASMDNLWLVYGESMDNIWIIYNMCFFVINKPNGGR